jgi:hypothetical protein
MSRLIVPMLYGDRQFGLFDGKEASLCSAPKIAPNYCYGKYAERYQYVTQVFAKSHGRLKARFNRRAPTGDNRQAPSANRRPGIRIANQKTQDFFACETLLRNGLVLQQGCAC